MQEHNAWLNKALGDLKSAKKLSKEDDETLDTAAYHTQQCAEKALKAFLIFNHHAPKKTHDLEKLLELCTKYDSSLLQLADDVIMLIPYATYTRYPDDYFTVNRTDVETAIVMADKILKVIRTKINEKLDPNLRIFP
ncbi:MAG: HEPN domain-containing protein [Candidatus Babeliales bacterium]